MSPFYGFKRKKAPIQRTKAIVRVTTFVCSPLAEKVSARHQPMPDRCNGRARHSLNIGCTTPRPCSAGFQDLFAPSRDSLCPAPGVLFSSQFLRLHIYPISLLMSMKQMRQIAGFVKVFPEFMLYFQKALSPELGFMPFRFLRQCMIFGEVKK
jgi:hypothetical protein